MTHFQGMAPSDVSDFVGSNGWVEKLLRLWGLPEGAGVSQRPDTAGDGLKTRCLPSFYPSYHCMLGRP